MTIKLEKTSYPSYSIELPISKKTVNYRAWNMQEQSILMMAAESGDPFQIETAKLQICQNICLNEIDVRILPAVESDLLFITARSKSVGEVTASLLEFPKLGLEREVKIDLTKVFISNLEDRNYLIPLLNPDKTPTGISFQMKELTGLDRLELLKPARKHAKFFEDELELIVKSIKQLCTETEAESIREREEEIRQFIREMAPSQYKPFQEFVLSQPMVKYEIDLQEWFPDTEELRGEKYPVEGLLSFFG